MRGTGKNDLGFWGEMLTFESHICSYLISNAEYEILKNTLSARCYKLTMIQI
jgi:hypothetical protein